MQLQDESARRRSVQQQRAATPGEVGHVLVVTNCTSTPERDSRGSRPRRSNPKEEDDQNQGEHTCMHVESTFFESIEHGHGARYTRQVFFFFSSEVRSVVNRASPI